MIGTILGVVAVAMAGYAVWRVRGHEVAMLAEITSLHSAVGTIGIDAMDASDRAEMVAERLDKMERGLDDMPAGAETETRWDVL